MSEAFQPSRRGPFGVHSHHAARPNRLLEPATISGSLPRLTAPSSEATARSAECSSSTISRTGSGPPKLYARRESRRPIPVVRPATGRCRRPAPERPVGVAVRGSVPRGMARGQSRAIRRHQPGARELGVDTVRRWSYYGNRPNGSPASRTASAVRTRYGRSSTSYTPPNVPWPSLLGAVALASEPEIVAGSEQAVGPRSVMRVDSEWTTTGRLEASDIR